MAEHSARSYFSHRRMNSAARMLAGVFTCLAGLAVVLQAHAQAVPLLGAGYTCCNFHHDGDWISDANWLIYPMIPAGTTARVLGYGEHRVNVEIGGRAMTLGLDYGRQQNLREWAQRMIVAQDPREKMADWPSTVREAIESGKVAVGMTKEQVVLAVGFPPAHATPSMEAMRWKYWFDTHGTYDVVWDDAGRVRDVATTPPIRFRVLAEEPVEAPLAPTGRAIQLKDLEGLLPDAAGVKK
jgi:hypothetical protein